MDTAAAAAAAGGGGERWGLGRQRQRRRRTMSAVGKGWGGIVVLVGSAESLERVPASLRRCFTHEVELWVRPGPRSFAVLE